MAQPRRTKRPPRFTLVALVLAMAATAGALTFADYAVTMWTIALLLLIAAGISAAVAWYRTARK